MINFCGFVKISVCQQTHGNTFNHKKSFYQHAVLIQSMKSIPLYIKIVSDVVESRH